MTVFEYELNDSKEVYTIEADFYAVEKETTTNLMGEESEVVLYVFYKDDEAFWRIPIRFMGKIREMKKCQYSHLNIGDVVTMDVAHRCICGQDFELSSETLTYLGHEEGRDVFSYEPALFCPNCGIRWSYHSFACDEFAS